jgi:integrase
MAYLTESAVDVARFTESFHQHLAKRGLSFNTITAYVSDLRLFLDWEDFSKSHADGLSLDDAASEWLNAHRPDWKPSTMARRIDSLRSWGRSMQMFLLVDYNYPDKGRPLAHPLPHLMADVFTLYAAMPSEHLKAGVVLCGMLGLRAAEAVEVRPQDFSIRDTDIKLTVVGKGYKARVIPVAPTVWAYLEQYRTAAMMRPGDNRLVPASVNVFRNAIARVGSRALGHPVSSHDLRHTFSTAYYAKCRDQRAVGKFLGHSSSKTTEGYIAVDENALAIAGEILL